MSQTKRISSLLILLIIVLSFASCGAKDDNKTKNENYYPTTAEKISTYPKPERKTSEKSENAFYARYTFTLDTLTDEINKTLENSDKDKIKVSDWKLLTEKESDDNKVEYDTYYYKDGLVTFVASVETQSKKIMSAGCGCSYEDFNDEKLQQSVLYVTSYLAALINGYEIKDENIDFIYDIFSDAAKTKRQIYYENNLYVETNDSKSVIFQTSQTSEEILKDKKIINYSFYDRNRF